MPLSKYDWILFDADNTLFDFDGASRLALCSLMSSMGIHDDKHSEYWSIYKEINHQVWRAFELGQIDAVTLRLRRFEHFLQAIQVPGYSPSRANEQYLKNLVFHSTLYEGVEDILALLSHCQLAIITNGLKDVQRLRFDKLGMHRFFDHIVISDEIGMAKPHGDFFDYTMNLIGHPPKEKVVVIGDNLMSDIKGGNDYGLDTIWYNPKQLPNNTDQNPTHEIRNLRQLIDSEYTL